MKAFFACTLASLSTLLVRSVGLGRNFQTRFDYEDPSSWAETEDEQCGGSEQSPIDLPPSSYYTEAAVGLLDTFSFAYESDTTTITVVNTGTTVEAEYHGYGLELTGGESLAQIVGRSDNATGNYVLEQFHFHWGSTDADGSEHTYDGQRYPLEVHLVHYNAEYGNVSNALAHPDGLLVVGVFFDVDNDADDVLAEFAEVVESEEYITNGEGEIEFSLSEVTDLLTEERFYLYAGSLTTPTCNEIVTWVVLKDHLTTSSSTLEIFRTVTYDDGTAIEHNYRNIQDGNGRVIIDVAERLYAIIPDVDSDDEVDTTAVVSVVMAIIVPFVILGAILGFMHYQTRNNQQA